VNAREVGDIALRARSTIFWGLIVQGRCGAAVITALFAVSLTQACCLWVDDLTRGSLLDP
jgi:uncharacterized membrane protein YfbV (UPF0208 family)